MRFNSFGAILLLVAITSISARAEHAVISGSLGGASFSSGGVISIRSSEGGRYCAPPGQQRTTIIVNPYPGTYNQYLTPTAYSAWGMPAYNTNPYSYYGGNTGWPYTSYNYGSYTFNPTTSYYPYGSTYGSTYGYNPFPSFPNYNGYGYNNAAYNNAYNIYAYNYNLGYNSYGYNPYSYNGGGYGSANYSQSYYNPWSSGNTGWGGTRFAFSARDGYGDVLKIRVRGW